MIQTDAPSPVPGCVSPTYIAPYLFVHSNSAVPLLLNQCPASVGAVSQVGFEGVVELPVPTSNVPFVPPVVQVGAAVVPFPTKI